MGRCTGQGSTWYSALPKQVWGLHLSLVLCFSYKEQSYEGKEKMNVQGAGELRGESLWLSSEPKAVGGRAEDLPLVERVVLQTVNVLS